MKYIATLNEDKVVMAKFVANDNYELSKQNLEITKQVYDTLVVPSSYKKGKFKALSEEEWPVAKEVVMYAPPERIPTEAEDLSAMVVDLAYNQILLELGVSTEQEEENKDALQNSKETN